MTSSSELERLYSAVEVAARLLGLTCSRAKVWPILRAYEPAFVHAAVAFRITTSARRGGELSFRYVRHSVDLDPYSVALSEGFALESGHPVDRLLLDIQDLCPIGYYGADFEISSGFEKVWPFFPNDRPQAPDELAAIPSMPRAVAQNADYLARHGLDEVRFLAIDYRRRTVNLYFNPDGNFRSEVIASMLRELSLPVPDDEMLER